MTDSDPFSDPESPPGYDTDLTFAGVDLDCVICGQPLTGLPDDQPDWPPGPMCANCYQAREMDNDLWAMELNADEDQ
jgi:hypothetical protein